MNAKNPYYQQLRHIPENSLLKQSIRVLYSTIVFVSSYIFVIYIHRLVTYFCASSLGYDVQFHFWGISGLPTTYDHWSKLRVLIVFGLGSFVLVATVLMILIFYKKIPRSWYPLKLFALWISINCLGLLGANFTTSIVGFGSYNSFYFSNFAVIFAWYQIPVLFLYLLVAFFIFLVFFLGFFQVNKILRFSHSQRLVKKYQGRWQIILQFYILPFIIGAFIILPFTLINIFFHVFHIFTLLLFLLGMITALRSYYRLKGVYRRDLAEAPLWFFIILALSMLLPVLNT